MCLSKVTNLHPKSEGVGWKVMIPSKSGGYYPQIFETTPLPVGEWIRDQNEKPVRRRGQDFYPSGFHIFLKEKDAKEANLSCLGRVVKVEYKEAVCEGKNYVRHSFFGGKYGKVVVARQIKIIG